MEAKSDRCLFVGYMLYKTLEQKLFVSRYTVFLEKEFLLREDSGTQDELSEVQSAQTDIDHLT